MFKANIIGKEILSDGRTKVEVSFTDGVKTFSQFVIPQDKDGLTYFIEGKLKELNITDVDIPIGEFKPPIVIPPVVDQAKLNWLGKVRKLTFLKTNLVDTKVWVGDEVEITSLQQDIKASFNPSFLD